VQQAQLAYISRLAIRCIIDIDFSSQPLAIQFRCRSAMSEHTYKQFDVDIDHIRSELLRMGGLVQSMIRDAMVVVTDGDVSALERVRENEKLVNQLEVDIDERITNLIALRQPAAVDLRIALAVTKMLTDMERCGDEAENIARRAYRIHDDANRFMPDMELQHMAAAVLNMLHDVMDSFARHDSIHSRRSGAPRQESRQGMEVHRQGAGVLHD